LFVSLSGNDGNSGSVTSPFRTVQHGIEVLQPGQTLYIRGGIYEIDAPEYLTNPIRIGTSATNKRNGTAQNPYRVFGYPGETAHIRFHWLNTDDWVGLRIFGDYWHLKSLTISDSNSFGILTTGDHNLFERLVSFGHQRSGLQITGASNFNTVLNCDAHDMFDITGRASGGGDGFTVKFGGGTGTYFKGCRAWRCSDDAWDIRSWPHSITFEDCWAFWGGRPDENGFTPANARGNGFKLGPWRGSLSDTRARHRLIGCGTFENDGGSSGNGFMWNANYSGIEFYNCTAWGNRMNFRLYNSAETDSSGNIVMAYHDLRNCISGGPTNSSDNFSTAQFEQNNTWNLGINVQNSHFQSVDTDQYALAPRNPDGSLPNNPLFRPSVNSPLVDAGVIIPDIDRTFVGSAPDVGAKEYGE
jgi:hypothetical protein